MKIFVLASLAALGGLAACNYIGDDNGCVVGFDEKHPQKDCRFGPPVPPGEGCGAPIPVNKDDAACKGLTWSGKVWPNLRGSCAISGCHDNGNGTGTSPPYLSKADPAAAFKALEGKSYTCGPYVSSTTPEKSQIINNLTGKPNVGLNMPPAGSVDEAILTTIDTWVKCGAPQ